MHINLSVKWMPVGIALTDKHRTAIVSALAKDFLAPCLELLQGVQHAVLIKTSL